jgi:hypothetical protein
LASVHASLNQRKVIVLRVAVRISKHVQLVGVIGTLLFLFGRVVSLCAPPRGRSRDCIEWNVARLTGLRLAQSERGHADRALWILAELAIVVRDGVLITGRDR